MWELMVLDARLVSPYLRKSIVPEYWVIQSLSLGRPPSFNMKHIDCRRPSYDVEYSTYATKPMRCMSNILYYCSFLIFLSYQMETRLFQGVYESRTGNNCIGPARAVFTSFDLG